VESYQGSVEVDVTNMVHAYWREPTGYTEGYTQRLWCAYWNALFPTNDGRSMLTWRDRFEKVTPCTYNFYSGGDEIYLVTNGTPSLWEIVFGDFLETPVFGNYAWWAQEHFKGRMPVDLGSSMYGGWEFTSYLAYNPDGVLLSPTNAAALSDAALREDPFFFAGGFFGTPWWISNLYGGSVGPGTTGSNYAWDHRNRLLVEMIPALTRAAGGRDVPVLDKKKNPRNLNLMTKKFQSGWPPERLANKDLKNRYLHRDFRDVGYVYIYRLYDYWVNTGALK
jgi:hypothetical protein